MALLRRDFERRQWLQIAVSFLFGFYTDLTMWLTGFLQVPASLSPAIGYPLRFIELLLGGGILAFGIALEVRCDSLMLAGEGFPLAIARFARRDFGKVKICTDTLLVTIGAVFMFVNFGHWDWSMVGIGTLISMFYVGMMVRVLAPHIKWLDQLLIPRAEREKDTVEEKDQWSGHHVITIARAYGSGGNDVAHAVAEKLGWPCYDRQLIDLTARRMGYSTEAVERSEQNIPTSRLWEMVMEDTGIPSSMNPSRDDAIFVSQSRTIRELAHEGNCVIVGRLANWTLRDHPHALRVFITSSRDSATKRVAQRLGISEEEAARKQTPPSASPNAWASARKRPPASRNESTRAGQTIAAATRERHGLPPKAMTSCSIPTGWASTKPPPSSRKRPKPWDEPDFPPIPKGTRHGDSSKAFRRDLNAATIYFKILLSLPFASNHALQDVRQVT